MIDARFICVLLGVICILLSAFPNLKLNQKGITLFNLGWAFVLAGVLLLHP